MHMWCFLVQFPYVQVAVRFKPGERSDTKLVLPLHQRLKMRKKGEDFLEKEPAEFLDALMNTVMTNPVRLPTSGRCVPAPAVVLLLQCC